MIVKYELRLDFKPNAWIRKEGLGSCGSQKAAMLGCIAKEHEIRVLLLYSRWVCKTFEQHICLYIRDFVRVR